MAIDTAQKRMSAIAPSSPWRGPMVAAAEAGFTQGNRQAADFMYSGILAEAAVVVAVDHSVNIRKGVSPFKGVTFGPVIVRVGSSGAGLT